MLAPVRRCTATIARTPRWTLLRRALYLLYTAVLTRILVVDGVPTGRTTLAVLVISALLLTAVGRGWRRVFEVLRDWLPFSAVLLAYDQTRGVADSLGLATHERDILHAERWVFGGTEPTLWLQQHLYDPAHVHWYDAAATVVYSTHFLMTPVLAGILWIRNRGAWLRYISRVITLAVAGLLTYCVFPEAPPWLAARNGLTAPVARLSARGWIWLHAGNLRNTLAGAQRDGANPIAAMPSLHTAFAVLAALAIARQLHGRWRWLLALYPAAMAFALVYTGEHWVLDIVGGVAYAFAADLAVGWVERRREDRRASGAAAVPADLPLPLSPASAGSAGPGATQPSASPPSRSGHVR